MLHEVGGDPASHVQPEPGADHGYHECRHRTEERAEPPADCAANERSCEAKNLCHLVEDASGTCSVTTSRQDRDCVALL
jgi:hypothetical protein